MEKFDLFVPFGEACVTSHNLRMNCLQSESLPFDWVKYVSLDKAITFLREDFKDFIVKDSLTEIKSGEALHPFAYKMPNGMEFLHDFCKPLEEDFEKVMAKYQRRIKRLYAKIRDAKSILFVHVCHDAYTVSDIEKYCDELQGLYPDKKIKLLQIIYKVDFKNILYKIRSEKFDVVEMPEPVGIYGSQELWDKMKDNFAQILVRYDFPLKLKLRIFGRIFLLKCWRNLYKFLVSIHCMFILSKQRRHKIRRKMLDGFNPVR